MHKVWLYAPGENASKWDVCLSQNIMCIGWDEMGNLLEYASKKEMAARLQEIYDKPEASFKNDSLALWEFAHEMQAGDIVIVKKGQNQIIGRGIVEGDYAFDESFPDFKNVRKMQWTNAGEWENIGKNVQKTLTDITKYPDYVESLEKLFEDKSQKQYWWLVASPKIWSFSKAPVGKIQDYTLYNDSGNQRRIFQNFIDAREGDIVIGYEATPVKQVVAIAEIVKAADGQKIYFKKTESLLNPIDYSVIKDIPELSGMEFLKNKNGSFFKLTKDEYNVLADLIRDENPITVNKRNPPYSGNTSEDKDLMDLLRTKAEELARQVNPGAANNSMHERSPERILADCIAGVVSEYFWKLYLNSEENVVSETEFDDASRQIDLKVISNNKKIEVRSSFPRNGIEFAICHPSYEFDVIGPYSNNYKPGEIQKDYYVRTLFHLYNPTDIISMISADSFKVYLTGGATWDMMIDTDYSKNKTLLPDFGLGVIQKASYRVVPFSKSKDTREIKRVIIEDQQVKN